MIADITFSFVYAKRCVLIGTLSGGGVDIKLRGKERILQGKISNVENDKN